MAASQVTFPTSVVRDQRRNAENVETLGTIEQPEAALCWFLRRAREISMVSAGPDGTITRDQRFAPAVEKVLLYRIAERQIDGQSAEMPLKIPRSCIPARGASTGPYRVAPRNAAVEVETPAMGCTRSREFPRHTPRAPDTPAWQALLRWLRTHSPNGSVEARADVGPLPVTTATMALPTRCPRLINESNTSPRGGPPWPRIRWSRAELADKFKTEKDSPYLRFVRDEGLDIISAQYVPNLRTVELKPWARKGGRGVFINHEASRTSDDCYVRDPARPGARAAAPSV